MTYKSRSIYKRAFLRAAALAVAGCVALSDVAFAAPSISAAPLPTPPASGLPVPVRIDPSAGWIEASYRAPGDAPTVILLQDAHANPAAQFNAARMIRSALLAAGSDLVMLEAGQGELNLDAFKAAGRTDAGRSAAAGLVRKGRLQGAEYLQLTSDLPVRLQGAENRAAYERALKVYREAVLLRPQALVRLARMEQSLRALGPEAFGPEFTEVWNHRLAHEDGSLGTAEYADDLLTSLRRHGGNDLLYPNLKSLSKLKKKEERVDFRRASDLLARLAPGRTVQELSDPEWISAFKANAGQMSVRDRVVLGRFLNYHTQVTSLDGGAVLSETRSAEREVVRTAAAGDPAAGRWAEAAERIEFVRKLLLLEADSGSVDRYFGEGESGPQTSAAARLNRSLLDLGRMEESVILDDPTLDRAVRTAALFYRLAGRRDRFLAGRAMAEMDRSGMRAAVLVAGGYHAANLKKIFIERGVSFVSLVPRTEAPTDRVRYEKLLLKGASAMALPPAGARCAFSERTREMLRAELTGLDASPAAERAAVKGARMSLQEPAAVQAPLRDRLVRQIEVHTMRAALRVVQLLYHLGWVDLGQAGLVLNRYHQLIGFQAVLEPDVEATFRMIGPYVVGTPINVDRKSGGVEVRPRPWQRAWIEWLTGQKTDPQCPLCPDRRGLDQETILTHHGSLATSNPFTILPEFDFDEQGHRLRDNRLVHLNILSLRHERMHVTEKSIRSLLGLTEELGPDYVVFQNGEGAGASLPQHHHNQAVNKIPAVMSGQFKRTLMRRFASEDLDRKIHWAWAAIRGIFRRPSAPAEIEVYAVSDYPGKPLLLTSRDADALAREAFLIAHQFQALKKPVGLIAREVPDRGYELYLFAFDAGKVTVPALPGDPDRTPRTIDNAQKVFEDHGLIGGAGVAQAAGLVIAGYRHQDGRAVMPTPASRDVVENLISAMLMPAVDFWNVVQEAGLADADKLEDLLGPDASASAARMAAVKAETRTGQYYETLGVTSTDVGTVPALPPADVAAAWGRYKTEVWQDVPEDGYPAVSAVYTRAARRTARLLYDIALSVVSDGDADLAGQLRTAAFVATGSFGRGQMTLRSDADHYWILPDDAYEVTPDGHLRPLPKFLALVQTYRRLHDQVLEGKPAVTSASVPLTPTRKRGDAAETLHLLLGPAADREQASEFDLFVRVTETTDSAYLAGDPDLMKAEKDDLLNRLDQKGGRGRVVKQLIRKAILIREEEYRSATGKRSGFGGYREWNRLQWLLDLEQRDGRNLHIPEWTARMVLRALGGHAKNPKVRQAFWRQRMRADGALGQTGDRRSLIDQARDSALLFDESVRVMKRLWGEVRDPEDPEWLEIFLASGEPEETMSASRVKALRRASKEEAVLEVGHPSKDGLTEILIAWPHDRPGLLADLTGILIDHGLELDGTRVRTPQGHPFNRFWVRGWPADPARAAELRLSLLRDLRGLRAGTLTVPGIFARDGHEYAFSRSSIKDAPPPVVWSDGNEVHVLAQEYYPVEDSNETQPSLFHLVSRWMAENDLDIVRTGSYRSQNGRVLASWSVRHAQNGSLAPGEIDEACRLMEKFLERPVIRSWSFSLSNNIAHDRLQEDLRSAAASEQWTVWRTSAAEAWQRYFVATWGITASQQLRSRLNDMDARLRMHAEGVRSVALTAFRHLLDQEEFRPLRGKLFLAETTELLQATLLPGRPAPLLLVPAAAADLENASYREAAEAFLVKYTDCLNAVLEPSMRQAKRLDWTGGAKVRFVDGRELASGSISGYGPWSDPETLASDDGQLGSLMEYADSRFLTASNRGNPLTRLKHDLLPALRDEDPGSWGSRVLTAAWNANFNAYTQGQVSKGFDGIHALQFEDLTPLLRYGRRLRLSVLARPGRLTEPVRDAEVSLLAFQHRLWLLRQVPHRTDQADGMPTQEDPAKANFADVYGIDFAQGVEQRVSDGLIPEAEMAGLKRLGLRDYVADLLDDRDRDVLGIHGEYESKLASDGFITKPLYRSARDLFEASSEALARRAQTVTVITTPRSKKEAEMFDLGMARVTAQGYLDLDAGWVPSSREEIGFMSSEDAADAAARWRQSPEEMLHVVRRAAELELPVSEEVLAVMRGVVRLHGRTLTTRWTAPRPEETEFAELAAAEFKALLNLVDVPVDVAMVDLYRSGLLSAVLPELGGAEDLGDKLQFHLHLPIWHTLRVFRNMECPERLGTTGADPETLLTARGMEDVRSRTAVEYRRSAREAGLLPSLRLAVLLHDAAKPGWRFRKGATHDEIVARQLLPAAEKRLKLDYFEVAQWLSFFDLEIPKVLEKMPLLDTDEGSGHTRISSPLRALIHTIMDRPDPQSGGRRIVEQLKKALQNGRPRPVTQAEALAAMLLFITCDEADTNFSSVRNHARALSVVWDLLTGEESGYDPMAAMISELVPQVSLQLSAERRARIAAANPGVEETSAVQKSVREFLETSDPSLWSRERVRNVAKYYELYQLTRTDPKVRLYLPPGRSRRTAVTVVTPDDIPGTYAAITGVLSAYAEIISSHAHAIGTGDQRVVFDRFEILWRDGFGPVDASALLEQNLTDVIRTVSRPETDDFENELRRIYRSSGTQLNPEQEPDRAGREYEFKPYPGPADVKFEDLGEGRYRVDVVKSDFPGLLHTVIYELWRLMGFEVESVSVATAASWSEDSIFIRTPSGKPLRPELVQLYEESLRIFLTLKLIRPHQLRQVFEVVHRVVSARENFEERLRAGIQKANASAAAVPVDPDRVVRGYRRVAAQTAKKIRDAVQGSAGLEGVLIDGPSGIGKTTFIRFLEEELRKIGIDPSVMPLDLFMRPTSARDEVKREVLQHTGIDPAYEASDEPSRIWREDTEDGVRPFLKRLFERRAGAAQAPQPSIRIPSAYVRSVEELDYSLFTEVDNYPRLAGVKDRASVDLLIPVRPQKLLILDGKYAHDWVPTERHILTVRLEGDETKIQEQFESRTRALVKPDGQADTERIEQTLRYQKSFLWPSWVRYKERTSDQVNLSVDLRSADPARWKLVERRPLLDGARLAASSGTPAITDSQAARFAFRVKTASRVPDDRGPVSVHVWDPAAPAAAEGMSVLEFSSEGVHWNGRSLELPSAEAEDAEPDTSTADLQQAYDRQMRSMDPAPAGLGNANGPLTVHLGTLNGSDGVAVARRTALAQELVRESRKDAALELYLSEDRDGLFGELLSALGFAGRVRTGEAPSGSVHLLTVKDRDRLQQQGRIDDSFRAVVLEDPASSEDAAVSVYAFRPLVRLARVLRSSSTDELGDYYKRITGRTLPPDQIVPLFSGDPEAARAWAFKPIRARWDQALALYAAASRMASRSA